VASGPAADSRRAARRFDAEPNAEHGVVVLERPRSHPLSWPDPADIEQKPRNFLRGFLPCGASRDVRVTGANFDALSLRYLSAVEFRCAIASLLERDQISMRYRCAT
jgi:hypothetical protein